MRYDEIEHLRQHHLAWGLLRAGNVALVLSFLSRVFIERNVGDLPASEVVSELDDELYALNQRGEDRFPRPAQAYLDEWTTERGWLRKFYPPGSDEPRYDISPVVEKTLLWVEELRGRDFVGTESRLNTKTINSSLEDIDYNEGRYIRLIAATSPNTDVRQFRADLRACTDSIVSADHSDQYSEQKFLQVKAVIDRFKGREGFTEIDRSWTRRVTDVRQWFVFSASERWRHDDVEYEHYSDSGGKSGGQKEKLAYTILAASLAYQFKLDWGATRSKAFRFVVIDEAFSRGSEASTRYALSLFTRLGLQLLIVTPLQKFHVIEPHVSAVGFVDNPNGNYSRLQSLSIAEFRRRLARTDETEGVNSLAAAGIPAGPAA